MPIINQPSGMSSGQGAGTTIYPNFSNILSADQQAANQTALQLEQLRQQGEALRNNLNVAGQNYAADREANTSLQLGQINADVGRRGQDFSLASAMRGYDVTEAGDRLRSEDTRRGQDVTSETSRRGQDLDFQAAMAPIDWQRERFNQVFPLFTGVMRDFGTFGPGGPGDDTGMWRGPPPSVTTGDMFTPDQTQQQVNAAYARNAAMADTQRRRTAESAGARGMSGTSPLLAALSAGAGASQMAADSEAAREIRLSAAKENAQHRLASETARDRGYVDWNNAMTARRNIASQQQNALLMALAGMM